MRILVFLVAFCFFDESRAHPKKKNCTDFLQKIGLKILTVKPKHSELLLRIFFHHREDFKRAAAERKEFKIYNLPAKSLDEVEVLIKLPGFSSLESRYNGGKLRQAFALSDPKNVFLGVLLDFYSDQLARDSLGIPVESPLFLDALGANVRTYLNYSPKEAAAWLNLSPSMIESLVKLHKRRNDRGLPAYGGKAGE